VRPTGPEGAEISTSTTTVVFPSAYDIDATGVLVGNELRMTGTLTEVDLARVERELETGWDGDASGTPVAGRSVDVVVNELVPVRRRVGSDYDFIEKVIRPRYEYDHHWEPVQTLSIESGIDGGLAFTIEVPSDEHQYQIVFTTRDDADRPLEYDTWVSPRTPETQERTGIRFVTDDGKWPDETSYGVGDMVTWRMTDDGATLPTGDANRYLYLIAQDGLRASAVTAAPTFRHRFATQDAPGIFVIGVRFTGRTYAPKAAAWADFEIDEREIHVQVTADRERYRPGESATLSIRTTEPDGSPIAATVVLEAVDEKLFAIGGASVPSPLRDLYDRVDSGIVRLAATHQPPTLSGPEGEGGDTTGGGDDRTEFRDSLVFRQLRTDATGRASATVRMSDDLTSWHVIASAVTADLRAGAGELLLPVGLPFFVELTLADTYQASDRPVVQVRAFGDALRAGDRVDFTVTSPSLALAETRVSGVAFEPVRVELPPLSAGSRSISARAVAPTRADAAGEPLTDGLTRTFEVVAARLSATEAAYGGLAEGLPTVPAGAEQSLWTFSDAGRGRLIPLLTTLADASGSRLDRLIAQQLAGDLLVSEFDHDPTSLPPSGFDPSRYDVGEEYDDAGDPVRAGVALVPGGGVDPWLAARIAVTAPRSLQRDGLLRTLGAIRELPTSKRDLQIAALAGMAGLGGPVLGDLEEARHQPALTPTEQIYLALGFEAIGDDATALTIERDLLSRYGEGLGAWVRLRFETTDDGADATALLAVVAAGIGDPLPPAWPTTRGQIQPWTPSTRRAHRVRATRARGTPTAEASFAYTLDGRDPSFTSSPAGRSAFD
jgi:hypothetical protein